MIFAHRLALATGRVDVDAMLHEITLPQMNRWMAYARIEPFGARAGWVQHADLMSMIYNIASSKDSKPAKRSDFLPG